MAFCIWDDGYLPTNAEWNYAAAGGSDQRVYPWSAPPSLMTITCSDTTFLYPDHDTCSALGAAGADAAGDGRWGQSDMGGSLSEWVLDYYADISTGSGTANAYIDPCTDCAYVNNSNEDPEPERRFRGGAYDAIAEYVRVSLELFEAASPEQRGDDVGFRCAYPATASN
jgi:formylglycine-generating enzyme required for sulfatase activity